MQVTRIVAVAAASVVLTASPAVAAYDPPSYPCSNYTASGMVGFTIGTDTAVCFEVGWYRGHVVNTTLVDVLRVSQADQVCVGQYPTETDPRSFVVCASVADVVRAWDGDYHAFPAIACVWVPTVSETQGMLCSANRASADLAYGHFNWIDAYLCPVPVPQYSGAGCLPYLYVPLGYPWPP